MFTKAKLGLAAVAVAATTLTMVTTAPAQAGGKHYSNCDALHRDFKHGVSKSKAAAQRQVRNGYGRPASGKRARSVYATNKGSLDRDKDGTACEA